MIKITNGQDVIEVTEGAYTSMYKDLGFYPVADAPKAEAKVEQAPEPVVEPVVAEEADASAFDIPENVAEEEEAVEETEEPSSAAEFDEAEKFMAEIVEKPIASWSKEEVKKYAALANIDLKGTKNVDEAKKLIKEHIG